LFSPSAISTLKSFTPSSPDSANAIKHLLALSSLINQAVGDALSDMLLVEVVLAHRGWTAPEWDAAYEDLPNRLVKVEVKDRFIFETTDAERRLVKPEGLQDMVNDAMGKVEMGRSFVRPSGTEDCVRVYAEAKSSADAEGESYVRARSRIIGGNGNRAVTPLPVAPLSRLSMPADYGALTNPAT
jgi:phosphoacetylglucosamine mutase